MQALFNLIFDNFLLVIIILAGVLVYRQYKDLKEKTMSIQELFDKVLNNYLDTKFDEAKKLAMELKTEYGHLDRMAAEIDRLLIIIERTENGTVNNRVEASNLINRFKVDKKIDYTRYPRMLELNDLGTFNEEDMESLDNGIAIARKEYNAQAFRYNEKASNFPIQYLTSYLKLNTQFYIFDAPKSSKYDDEFEVFEEVEPEINSLTSLNMSIPAEDEINNLLKKKDKEDE